jgi:hypothetical protein
LASGRLNLLTVATFTGDCTHPTPPRFHYCSGRDQLVWGLLVVEFASDGRNVFSHRVTGMHVLLSLASRHSSTNKPLFVRKRQTRSVRDRDILAMSSISIALIDRLNQHPGVMLCVDLLTRYAVRDRLMWVTAPVWWLCYIHPNCASDT